MSYPDLIISSDEHLREDTPVCRIDNYIEAQTEKLRFLKKLQEEYNCPIVSAGDLFHKWKSSPWLLRHAIKELPDNIITIPGNHDIPNHSMGSYDRSSLSVIEQADKIKVLKTKPMIFIEDEDEFEIFGLPYGQEIPVTWNLRHKCNILLLHQMCWQGKSPYPGAEKEGGEAKQILKKYTDFNLIITGHNHQSFIEEHKDRILINPGSMMRMTADQIDSKPSVYLWWCESNKVERIYYPINKNAVSKEHLNSVQNRNENMEAFIQRLKSDVEIGLSFEKAISTYVNNNKIPLKTKSIIEGILNDNT